MLEERPLSNITVKDIVEKCGINRNSFYYHYQDIPALIEEIVKEEAEQILEKYPSVSTIVECFDALIEFASHRKRAIMHIYRFLYLKKPCCTAISMGRGCKQLLLTSAWRTFGRPFCLSMPLSIKAIV